jgi:hypothetical protein
MIVAHSASFFRASCVRDLKPSRGLKRREAPQAGVNRLLLMGLDRFRARATVALDSDFGTPRSCDEACRSLRFEPGIQSGSISIVIGARRVARGGPNRDGKNAA